jgi:hypothetical protein
MGIPIRMLDFGILNLTYWSWNGTFTLHARLVDSIILQIIITKHCHVYCIEFECVAAYMLMFGNLLAPAGTQFAYKRAELKIVKKITLNSSMRKNTQPRPIFCPLEASSPRCLSANRFGRAYSGVLAEWQGPFVCCFSLLLLIWSMSSLLHRLSWLHSRRLLRRGYVLPAAA